MGGNLFGIGFGEIVFLAILALIVFGPKRIPEVARTIGRLVRQVRQATGGIEDEMRQLMTLEPDQAPREHAPLAPELYPGQGPVPLSSSVPPEEERPEPPSAAPPALSGGGEPS